MRRTARTPTFGGDRLCVFPWTGVGRLVDDAEAEEVLSNECRCDGTLVAEPGVRVRGYLLRFSREQREVHRANGHIGAAECGAILWTEDEDVPRVFWDEVRALERPGIEIIERNSTTVQLRRLAAGHGVESVGRMAPDDPARGIAALMIERKAPDDEQTEEEPNASTERSGKGSRPAAG